MFLWYQMVLFYKIIAPYVFFVVCSLCNNFNCSIKNVRSAKLKNTSNIISNLLTFFEVRKHKSISEIILSYISYVIKYIYNHKNFKGLFLFHIQYNYNINISYILEPGFCWVVEGKFYYIFLVSLINWMYSSYDKNIPLFLSSLGPFKTKSQNFLKYRFNKTLV